MSPSEVFAMLRERLSHSLIDGRLLTAAGPSGEDGLQRLLQDRFVLEELTGRLLSLFRIGEDVLGMDTSSAFKERRARAERLAAVIGGAAGGKELSCIPESLRTVLLEIRGLLREMAEDRGGYRVLWPCRTLGGSGEAVYAHVKLLSSLIASALSLELTQEEAEEFARQYWTARMSAEEGAVTACMHQEVSGTVVVANSLEDVLWAFRSFDDIAGIAMAAGCPTSDKLFRAERMLGGGVSEKLGELELSIVEVISCPGELDQ